MWLRRSASCASINLSDLTGASTTYGRKPSDPPTHAIPACCYSSTQQAKRQDMVDRFNRATPAQSFIFLLSAKSGGAGLNLIGASRLIMLDCDWCVGLVLLYRDA